MKSRVERNDLDQFGEIFVMEARITFSISGENFNAKSCIERLNSNQLKIFLYQDEFPNSISFVHPNEFIDYHDESYSAYEKAYLDFIINNIAELVRCGANNFSLFTEMYIQNDEQCNFEVLSSAFYPYIWKYEIRMPTSVYIIEDETPIQNT